MFIQTEATPNPATLKFLPGRMVLGTGTAEFRDADEAAGSPLAERLFAVPGVGGVFLGGDFITVTKTDGEWQHLKPAILGAIMEHFMSGMPVLRDAPAAERRRRVLRRGRRRDGRDHQGADRDARAPGGRPGRRRHHLPRLPRRRRLPQHARLLRRLPVVDRDAEARHREPAPPFRPGSARDPGSLSRAAARSIDGDQASSGAPRAGRRRRCISPACACSSSTPLPKLLRRRCVDGPPAGARLGDDRPRPCRAADGHGRPRRWRDAGLAFAELDRIAVTVGPGFVHRACGSASPPRAGWRWSSAARWSASARSPCMPRGRGRLPGRRPVLAALDARRGEVYGQAFAADGAPLGAARGRRRRPNSPRGSARTCCSPAPARRSSRQRWRRRRARIVHRESAADSPPSSGSALAAPPPGASPRPLYLRPPDAKPQQAARGGAPMIRFLPRARVFVDVLRAERGRRARRNPRARPSRSRGAPTISPRWSPTGRCSRSPPAANSIFGMAPAGRLRARPRRGRRGGDPHHRGSRRTTAAAESGACSWKTRCAASIATRIAAASSRSTAPTCRRSSSTGRSDSRSSASARAYYRRADGADGAALVMRCATPLSAVRSAGAGNDAKWPSQATRPASRRPASPRACA